MKIYSKLTKFYTLNHSNIFFMSLSIQLLTLISIPIYYLGILNKIQILSLSLHKKTTIEFANKLLNYLLIKYI